jgi:acetyl-CoA carboxylase biotin carboxyl carrier protein
MKPSELKDIIDFIAKSNLDEVNIETEGFKIAVKRSAVTMTVAAAPAAPVQAPPAPVAAAPVQTAPAAPATEPEKPAAPASGKKMVEIKSPMIGTFYRASAPEKPPLVSVGDEIKVGQSLCIIEAMKLFNEIESDVAGRIVKVMAENATPVEYDQVLFVVETD